MGPVTVFLFVLFAVFAAAATQLAIKTGGGFLEELPNKTKSEAKKEKKSDSQEPPRSEVSKDVIYQLTGFSGCRKTGTLLRIDIKSSQPEQKENSQPGRSQR
ncbi:predicted protein [Coccidioides posadasii str. Silveira]|uniref:Predicted protein n=1 Tax=Coccidioides posadasii (strain RMSCC 757 / Silveira) TaxID=443226 RepID=E9D980_COCPS|nr:predicted protein [Coccidioides posadasii str. Silveira]